MDLQYIIGEFWEFQYFRHQLSRKGCWGYAKRQELTAELTSEVAIELTDERTIEKAIELI